MTRRATAIKWIWLLYCGALVLVLVQSAGAGARPDMAAYTPSSCRRIAVIPAYAGARRAGRCCTALFFRTGVRPADAGGGHARASIYLVFLHGRGGGMAAERAGHHGGRSVLRWSVTAVVHGDDATLLHARG